MGSLFDLFLKHNQLLEDAFDLDEEGNLIEKNASKVMEADSVFHGVFVSDMHEMLKEFVYDPHAPTHIEPPQWGGGSFDPSWLSPAAMSVIAPQSGSARQQVAPATGSGGERVVTKTRTSRPDLIHGTGNGPQATGTGPAFGNLPSNGSSQTNGQTNNGSGQSYAMTGTTFGQKAPGIMQNLMRDFNLKDYQAAAIVGNIGHESGGFKYQQEISPRGGGRGGLGWAQWTGPRRVDFENYTKQNGLDPRSDEANYGFLKNEISTKYQSTLAGLKNTNNSDQAMRTWEGGAPGQYPGYEGAGVKNYPSRLNYTNQALAAYNQSQQSPQTAQQQQSPQPQSGLARYATGNAVPGAASSVDRVHPEFSNRINNMVSNMPPDLASQFQISSGFRDADRENQVYQTQHQGQSIPTDSYHSHGMAVDINRNPQVQQWISQNGSKYGVGFTLANTPNEDNHLEPTENGARIPHQQIGVWAANNTPQQQQRPTTQLASNNQSQSSSGQQVKPLAIGDSLAVGVGGVYGNTKYAAGGWNPQKVDGLVDRAIADGSVNGKPIVLSGGASNAGGNTQMVQQYYPQMIKKLQDAGASSVHVMGVGPYSHYDNYGYNDAINKASQNAGAHFTGPLASIASFSGTDLNGGVHPNDYRPIANHINQQLATPSTVAQTSNPAPQQMASAQQPQKSLAGSDTSSQIQTAVTRAAAQLAPSSPPSPTPDTPPPAPPPNDKSLQMSSVQRRIAASQLKLSERRTRSAIGLLRGI